MTAETAPADDVPHWARPLYEQRIAELSELAGMAMAMARAVKDRTLAMTEDDAAVEPAVLEGLSRAFGRASRALRLTALLQDRLIKAVTALDKGEADAAGDSDGEGDEPKVPVVFGPGTTMPPAWMAIEAARTREVLRQRLDREYLERLPRAVDETLGAIRHDLGLEPRVTDSLSPGREGPIRTGDEKALSLQRSPRRRGGGARVLCDFPNRPSG